MNNYKLKGRRSLKTLNIRLKKHLTPFFGGLLLTSITDDVIAEYGVQRQEAGASNGTINRELTALKRMFTLAHRAKRIQHRPFIELLEENNVRKGIFEPEQFESVRNHLPAHMQGVAAFAYITGWRTPSEVLTLEWHQVDFGGGLVQLDTGTTKNGEGRTFPLGKELRLVLEHQRAMADRLQRERGMTPRHVFFHPEGGRFGGRELKAGRRITGSSYYHAWVKAAKAAGCPGRIPHDFRRTAARRLDQLGIARSTAMNMMGHKTEEMYRRYAISNEKDEREAVRKLDEALARGVTVNCYSDTDALTSAG